MNLVLAFLHLFQKRTFRKKMAQVFQVVHPSHPTTASKDWRKPTTQSREKKTAYISIKLPSESPVKQRVVGRDKQRLQNSWEKYLLKEHLQCNSIMSHIDWVKVLRPTRHKTGHIGDVFHSQSLGLPQPTSLPSVLWHCCLGGRKGIRSIKNRGGWWRWALASPDGVAPNRIVGVSASVNLP